MITEVEKQDYGMKEEVNPEYRIRRMWKKGEKRNNNFRKNNGLGVYNRRSDVIGERRRGREE